MPIGPAVSGWLEGTRTLPLCMAALASMLLGCQETGSERSTTSRLSAPDASKLSDASIPRDAEVLPLADASSQNGDAASRTCRPPRNERAFVETPVGYLHRSCVHRVLDGESVHGNEIVRSDGSRIRFHDCRHPAYDRSWCVIDSDSLPTNIGKIAYAAYTLPCPEPDACLRASYLSASWTVPKPPAELRPSLQQTVYVWPGLFDNSVYVYQPVLGWHTKEADGTYHDGWSISSWKCSTLPNCWNSTPISVNPGDVINGVVQGANCSSGICSSVTITTTNTTTGSSTTLSTDPGGRPFYQAIGGLLEAFRVDQCSYYPPTGTVFSSIVVKDQYGGTISNIPWTSSCLSSPDPACGFRVCNACSGVVCPASTVDLGYNLGVQISGDVHLVSGSPNQTLTENQSIWSTTSYGNLQISQ